MNKENTPKKVIRRMCLCNWGGISHKILKFHEYVNLFSGKSGSGKSTVMDALQVVLYGSFSQNFLNKAADDAKNRRSVISYLRGAQKDGSFNRGGQDFSSLVVLEIEDVGRESFACVGVCFEVRKNDTELKKYTYFSHAGRMPEQEYLTENKVPFTHKDITALLKERIARGERFDRGEVNRTYPSAEAYRRSLYDIILGGIDGSRFTTMEKSAIALRMSNGTGQFIRDYMFPQSHSDAIGRLSEQLGAYREIREKIEDLKKRIGYLTQIQDSWNEKTKVELSMMENEKISRYADICDMNKKIELLNAELEENLKQQGEISRKKEERQQERDILVNQIISLKADIQSGDLGTRTLQFEELGKRKQLLEASQRRFESFCEELDQWENNETVADYLSNKTTSLCSLLKSGEFSENDVEALRESLKEERKNLEELLEDITKELREHQEELSELRQQVEDMRQNRKTYPPMLRQARALLQERLTSRYSKTIPVHILADLFDVSDPEWKNAVEGRLGRLKYSLVTEPEYADDAAELFRKMSHFQNVELLHTGKLCEKNAKVMENSLFEAVSVEEDYVKKCLRRYLGNVIKCETVEELKSVKDGVTKDCYSYSNFIFRHLRREDYERNACIGRRISKDRLKKMEQQVLSLGQRCEEREKESEAIKKAREYEYLKLENSYYLEMAKASKELASICEEEKVLSLQIEELKKGTDGALNQQLLKAQAKLDVIDQELRALEDELGRLRVREGIVSGDQRGKKERLSFLSQGFQASESIQEKTRKLLEKRSAAAVKKHLSDQLEIEQSALEKLKEQTMNARLQFIAAYPSLNLQGGERTNEAYQQLLLQYQKDFEPEYQKEFAKQYELVYKSLRDHVIATIHGDIKAAKRHEYEINRLLRQTNFSDSTYQIEITAADNENGQFYDMLMAPELDSKNLEDEGFEGQLSFGEDSFYQKYEDKIRLLTEKFMPLRGQEDEFAITKWQQEMEQYSDYRNYLSFRMYERVEENPQTIRKNYVDEMAGRDSGGEGQNPKYVALLAGFAMLYAQANSRESKIKLVLLDEAFSKMDQERSAVCLKYARMMDLQLIVCVPDERLQSLIRNVDCVYGFRRVKNQISMMHIDKGDYLKLT